MSDHTPVLSCGPHGSWLYTFSETLHGPSCDLLANNAPEQLGVVLSKLTPGPGELILLVDSASATRIPAPARLARVLQQHSIALKAIVLRRAVQPRVNGLTVRPSSGGLTIGNTDSGVVVEVPMNFHELRSAVANVVSEAFAEQHNLDLQESPIRTDDLLGLVQSCLLAPPASSASVRLSLGGLSYSLPRDALCRRLNEALRPRLEPALEALIRIRGNTAAVAVAESLAGLTGLPDKIRSSVPDRVAVTTELDDELAEAARRLAASPSTTGGDVWTPDSHDADPRDGKRSSLNARSPRWTAPAFAALVLVVAAQGAWIIRHAMLDAPSEEQLRAVARTVLAESEEQMRQAAKRQQDEVATYLQKAEQASADQLRAFDVQSKQLVADLEKGVGEARRVAQSASVDARKAAEAEVQKGREQVDRLVATTSEAITKAKVDLEAGVAEARKSMLDFSKPVQIAGPLTVVAEDGGITRIAGGAISISRKGSDQETVFSDGSFKLKNAATKSSFAAGFNGAGLPALQGDVEDKTVFLMCADATHKSGHFKLSGFENPKVGVQMTISPDQGGRFFVFGEQGTELLRLSGGGSHGRVMVFSDSVQAAQATFGCDDDGGSIVVRATNSQSTGILSCGNDGTAFLRISDKTGRGALTCGVWQGGIHDGEGYVHPLNPLTESGVAVFPNP